MAKNIFPYELPKNWQWSTLGDVCNLSQGEKLSAKKLPYFNVKYLRGTNEKNFVESGNYVEEGSKLILVDGENSGEIFTVKENGYMGSTLRELKIFETVDADFFQYFVSTKKELYRKNKRGSAIPHLNKKLFYSTPIPLPPLDEQKRIVAVIESLFEKLDAAKSIVQKILDGYELRRAAILHKAFTGELTKNFRADNGLTLDDWQEKKLGDVIELSTPKTNSFNEHLKYVGLENISKDNGKITFQSAAEVKSTKNIFHSGDLLYGKLRPYLNKHGIPNFDGVCSTDILVLNANELSTNEFINYFFSLPTFVEYVVSNSKGINLPRVSAQVILNAEINLPPLSEQKEIVRVLDRLLNKEQRTKEIAEKILLEIDLLKRTILARAFRGALGTNN